MAKVKGPLFSMEARGAVGKNLIFQNQNGVGVVKNFAKPANPNTAAQQASRANFSAVAAAWKTWIDNGKQTWDAAINGKYLTTKAAFFGINLLRLEQGHHIATYYTGTAAVDAMDFNIVTADGGGFDPSGLYRKSATFNGAAVYERIGDTGFVLWRNPAGNTWYIAQKLNILTEDYWSKMGTGSVGGTYEIDLGGNTYYCDVEIIYP